jgi:hypothetical protein
MVAILVAILGDAGVAQVGAVVVIIDMLFNPSEFCSSRLEMSALLARGTKLFNGDCVATTRATRCRFSSKKSHSVPLLVQKMMLAVRARLRFAGAYKGVLASSPARFALGGQASTVTSVLGKRTKVPCDRPNF